MNWKKLEDLEQLKHIQKDSNSKSQIIFKHSTRCSISSMAKKRLESQMKDFSTSLGDVWYLDLIQYRNISNSIEKDFDVMHQSPQLLLIKGGKCVFNASHFDISLNDLPT